MLSLFCWSFAAVASDNELIFDLCKDNKGNWTLVKEILCYFFSYLAILWHLWRENRSCYKNCRNYYGKWEELWRKICSMLRTWKKNFLARKILSRIFFSLSLSFIVGILSLSHGSLFYGYFEVLLHTDIFFLFTH